MRKRNTITGNRFNGKEILEYKHRNIGMDTQILETIDEHLKDALERHSKVLVVRFDVRFPEDESNRSFSKFQAEFMRKERRAGYDPSYVAVREVGEREGHPHYHEVLLVNGNNTQSIHKHIENANAAMNLTLGVEQGETIGLIHSCTSKNGPLRNGIMIHREALFPDDENDAFRQASYLAKESQKDTPNGMREVFASNLKRRKER